VAIMDQDGTLLPPGHEGEIVIRGEHVMVGYANDPAINETAFAGGWFRTGDSGRFDADGYVFLTGRIKEIINRGGEKVAPREVEEALLAHPRVAQAVVFGIPHPRLGEEVAAAVVLREDGTATERDIRAFALSRLSDFKVPSRVVFVDQIPTGPSGKVQRVGLHEALAPLLTASFVAPCTPTEEALAGLWAEILGLDRVGIHDRFLELGGDSLLATQVISRVRQIWHVEVPLHTFFQAPTVASMALIIIQQKAAQVEPDVLACLLAEAEGPLIDDASPHF
jgi:oxalate---CoA ligase